MLNSDDFAIIVPPNGEPRLVQLGEALSPFAVPPFTRVNKTVVFRGGRSIKGSIYRGRTTTAADELQIMGLLSVAFDR